MRNYLQKILALFEREGIESLKRGSNDDKTLLFLYVYYHYFNADDSKLQSIVDGCTFDRNQNDIDGIYIDENSDVFTIDFIHSRYYENEDFFFKEYERVLAILKVLSKKLSDLRIRQFNLEPFVKERYDDLTKENGEETRFCLKLITNVDPSRLSKASIRKDIGEIEADADRQISIDVVFGEDLVQEINDIENPKEYVESGKLVIEDHRSIVFHGREKSLITSISAQSLSDLYSRYGATGLFAMNLRYYVKSTKIDDFITDTIRKQGDKFWYYNNGIIIVCDDYAINGNEITLTKFSIVNGGQTTKLVGSTDFDIDFHIPCKIIKNNFPTDEGKLEFIAGVAEASNTQKPIKAKDLIANRVEQRKLKLQMKDAGVFVQIKRGDRPNKLVYPNPWQNTSNDEIAQFLYSFFYQKPGAARNNKSKMLSDEKTYTLIFGREYSSDVILDLLYIKSFYSDYVKKIQKQGTTDEHKIGILKNSMFFMVAIIGLVSKFYFNEELSFAVAEDRGNMERLRFLISQRDIDHKIFKNKEAYLKSELYLLFDSLYGLYLAPAYMQYKQDKAYNVYSNFTKVDVNYLSIVVSQILYSFNQGFPQALQPILKSIMHEQTKEEKELVDSNFVKDFIPGLEEQLKIYRKEKSKELKIRPSDIFTESQLTQIMQIKPTSLFHISHISRYSDQQISDFGSDIIEIVKRFLQQ